MMHGIGHIGVVIVWVSGVDDEHGNGYEDVGE